MGTKVIVTGFAAVVAGLTGLGVWGWYASDESRAEVERIRAERIMRIFCEEYPGVDNISENQLGYFVEPSLPPAGPIGPETPPLDDPASTSTTVFDEFQEYQEYQYTDVRRLAKNAPPGVSDDIEIVAEAYDAGISGSPTAFERPAVAAAIDRIMAFGDRRCP